MDDSGPVTLTVAAGALDAGSAHLPDGTPVAATVEGDRVTVRIPPPEVDGPAVMAFRLR